MALPGAFMNEQATVTLRAPSDQRDAYNNATYTTSDGQAWPCSLQPLSLRLEQDTRDLLGVGYDVALSLKRIFLPPEAPLDAASIVEVEGVTYSVVGDPLPHQTIGGLAHLVCILREIG